MRMTLGRDPGSVVKTDRIDHERVSFPMTDRMPHPFGIHIFGMAAPVEKNLAMAGDVVLKEHDKQGRGLHQLVRKRRPGVGYAPGQAVCSGSVLRVVRSPLREQLLNPG